MEHSNKMSTESVAGKQLFFDVNCVVCSVDITKSGIRQGLPYGRNYFTKAFLGDDFSNVVCQDELRGPDGRVLSCCPHVVRGEGAMGKSVMAEAGGGGKQ